MSQQPAISYLPVLAAGQWFGIKIGDIEAVHRVTDQHRQSQHTMTAEKAVASVPVVSLSALLGDAAARDAEIAAHIVIIKHNPPLGLQVARIAPQRHIDQLLNLPAFYGQAARLFAGITQHHDQRLLIIDAQQLAGLVLRTEQVSDSLQAAVHE